MSKQREKEDQEDGSTNPKSEDLKAENERLKTRVKELEHKVEDLEKQLSEKKEPPKWAKPNKKKSSKKSKKIGAKKGHKANPRKPVDLEVNNEVHWVPELCLEGNGLLPFPSKWHEHIQIDIPIKINFLVTKHVVGWSWCKGCDKYHSAVDEKLSKTKYGANLHAYVTDLKFNLGLTLGKIKLHLSERFNLEISTGVISEMISRTSETFSKDYEGMKGKLKYQQSLYADETGWRNSGNNEWLWSFSNERMSVYTIEPSRAQKVVEDILGESFYGVLVSDFYGGYNKIVSDKQKCWAHLLRELHVLRQKEPENKEVIYFKMRLEWFFKRAQRLKGLHQKGEDVKLKLYQLESDTLVFLTKDFETKKLKTLIKRMEKYYCELYTFITRDVEPTNNPAEREIRPAVLLRKISYGNRSDRGKKAQAMAMSMISTSKKQGQNFIHKAAENLKNL